MTARRVQSRNYHRANAAKRFRREAESTCAELGQPLSPAQLVALTELVRAELRRRDERQRMARKRATGGMTDGR